jgi:hypothetical protein
LGVPLRGDTRPEARYRTSFHTTDERLFTNIHHWIKQNARELEPEIAVVCYDFFLSVGLSQTSPVHLCRADTNLADESGKSPGRPPPILSITEARLFVFEPSVRTGRTGRIYPLRGSNGSPNVQWNMSDELEFFSPSFFHNADRTP